ncbi:MAG: hypothetical protein V9G20_09285 [Candidatus Promineifilaceae bacterium]
MWRHFHPSWCAVGPWGTPTKCRAIWQIARTIYQIVLQIFIPLGVPKAHGELLRKLPLMVETRIGKNTDRNEKWWRYFHPSWCAVGPWGTPTKCRAIWQIARTIYQIVLQIFIPLGVPKAHGELLRKLPLMVETRIGKNTDRNEKWWRYFHPSWCAVGPWGTPTKCRAIWQIARTIYQIVLQIFIPLGVPKAHGELLRKLPLMVETRIGMKNGGVIFIHLGVHTIHGELL